ncbi:MAG TPA: glycosyltransferase family protein [Planctomycetaceae bacterium]|nr:glycosyltransferase family protein [Planctomycetaceae bacterium]
MRIVYGAFAQGHGHFSKAAVLVPLLESRGHDVCVVSSGPQRPPHGYRFRRHRHFPGLAYLAAGGRVQYGRSAVTWLAELPLVLGHLRTLRHVVREFEPDLIVSDFEPLTASPWLRPECEVVALSRQAALIDPGVPLPDGAEFEQKLTRSVIRLFTAGADRLLGYHYAPESHRCLPPIVRPDVLQGRPERGDHLLVYNHFHAGDGGTAAELVDWAWRNGRRVCAYGFPEAQRGRHGPVEFRPADRRTFVADLRTARAVVTSAGFTTPLEAFVLRKPVVVVALPRQWEQRVNAFHVEDAGLAAQCARWDFSRALELPEPAASHPLLSWLTTPPEQVVEFLLDGCENPAPATAPASPLTAAVRLHAA